MRTFDPVKVHACILYDASIVFPEPLRSAIRTPFKPSSRLGTAALDGMSVQAHEGLFSIEENSSDHFWSFDLETGEQLGSLPTALAKAFLAVRDASPRLLPYAAGRLSHLCADAFLFPNLIEMTDGEIVRGRVAHDLDEHLVDTPFLWQAVQEGDAFKLATSLSCQKAIEIALDGYRQTNIDIANCYLYGNGWPVAKPILAGAYYQTCNELAKAVILARGEK